MDTVDFNVNIELTNQMSIKFIWTSDPHMQYEGWYIDDVCFYRGEPSTWELVFQGHKIFYDILAGTGDIHPAIEYCFPLEWDPEPDTVYWIRVCGQVFDPAGCDTNPDNDCDDEYIEIMDLHDVASVETVGPPNAIICDDICPDIPFEVTVQNVGTFPEIGFDVTLEATREMQDVSGDLIDSDWTLYWGGPAWPALAHITDCPDFDYDGGGALAIATEDCDFPVAVPRQFDMPVSNEVFDLSGDNINSAEMTFFAKYSFSEQIGTSSAEPIPPTNILGYSEPDHWFITVQDANLPGYIIRCSADSFGEIITGQNGQWEGATAPGANPGMYTVDLLDMMNQIRGAVPFLFEEKVCRVGFGVIMNDDEYIRN
jgi:hypothetical protein